MTESAKVIHRVETFAHTLEVFGEPDMGWYAWRLISLETGRQVQDDGNQGYGSDHVALREGLNAAARLED